MTHPKPFREPQEWPRGNSKPLWLMGHLEVQAAAMLNLWGDDKPHNWKPEWKSRSWILDWIVDGIVHHPGLRPPPDFLFGETIPDCLHLFLLSCLLPVAESISNRYSNYLHSKGQPELQGFQPKIIYGTADKCLSFFMNSFAHLCNAQ